ncbi:MAG: hypothetical protein HY695_10230 [Deltaproteobacteria bacterium]|nr:hypothetical protein [Deltaproteobacteria bacterium]
MAEKILVPLKRDDRVGEIIPYLEKVTQPGMSVVFLIHHPVNGLKWLHAYCGIMECGIGNALALRRMVESYSVKMRKQLAQQRVFHTCETLRRLGVKTTVDIYAGSLQRALQSSVNNGEPRLVVLQPGIGQRIVSFLQGTVTIRSMFRRPSSSVVLLRPGT